MARGVQQNQAIKPKKIEEEEVKMLAISDDEKESDSEQQVEQTKIANAVDLTNDTTSGENVLAEAEETMWAISQNASLKALHQSMQNTRPIEKSNGSNTESQPVSSTLQKPEDKPAVGSEEWHKQRRENHKQVERRRRETINDGINEIARIVPGCEKNKGSILNRAAAYIRQLKETEAASVEKWSLEKLLTDQAISELNRQIEAYKAKLEQVELQNNYLKRELNAVTEMSENKKAKLEHTTES